MCAGEDPISMHYSQDCMRMHLESCLKKRKMDVFPSKLIRNEGGNSLVSTVPIFCNCRLPEEGKMVQCDVCSEWYHKDCIAGIPKTLWHRKNTTQWCCPVCTEYSSVHFDFR